MIDHHKSTGVRPAGVIIIHGPTRAGKSWQARRLADKHGYFYLSSGDLLRATDDPKILAHMGSGNLALSEDVERLVFAALPKIPTSQTIVFDGFPRMIDEFHNLEHQLKGQGRKIWRVFEIYIPPTESDIRAARRARDDDTRTAIERKWHWYNNDTRKVLDYCSSKGWLQVIDGVGAREEVAERIEETL